MIFGAVPVREAEGAILAHSQIIGGRRIAKGERLTAAHVAAAETDGLDSLMVARLEAGDVPEDEAAARLAQALAGEGLTPLAPVHGRANIAAASAGLLRCEPASVDAFNGIDEAMTLGVLAPHARVAAGDIVATVKIIPYAVQAGRLAKAEQAALSARLSLAPFAPATIDLIQTRLPGQPDKLFAKTEQVTRARVESLGSTLGRSLQCPHDAAALAELLTIPSSARIILVAGASATVDRRDVVPAAIAAAGGRIERLGMPVDPGNLLCLGFSGDKPVLGLPGCARSIKRNGFDWVLERLLAGLPVDSAAIARMGVGGLLPELDRPEPRATMPKRATKVGAIILAAGRSSRMGGSNKLLADLGGRPVVAHVRAAIADAGLPPPVVVLGNMAEPVRAALDGPAIFTTAPDFAEGLSRSLRAGIAAVPADWDSAIICLGDMPRIGAALLRTMAAAFRGGSEIVVPSWNGKRGNPVLWSRAHFPALATLSGDVGGKALLAELADHVTELPVDSDGILADIDTPEALAAARADFESNERAGHSGDGE